MFCPSCAAEYRPEITVCPDCEVPLVADRSSIPPPTAHLGRFHLAVAEEVAAFARRRGIEPRTEPTEIGVEIRVPAHRRDGLRADLMVAWPSLVGAMEPEEQEEVRRLEGPLAGWHDAPEGVWVDREGRMRASAPREEEETADAERVLGPALLAIGLIVLLVAWYVGPGLLRLVGAIAGLGLLLLGMFAPR